MSTVSIYRTEFLKTISTHEFKSRHKLQRLYLSPIMKMDSKSNGKVKKGESLIKLRTSLIPHVENSGPSNLRFDRLQPSDHDLNQDQRLEFGKFIAREAVLDEEIWTAAWLRAESHSEDRQGDRYVDSFRRQFAEQEFNAIKKRYNGQNRLQSFNCVVTIIKSLTDPLISNYQVRKEEKNVKRTVLKSVVGTLDSSVRYLLHGESFPGEREKQMFCSVNLNNKYVYISNLCVSKSARRQSIGSNMLKYVIESARSKGIEDVYVHVHRNNEPATELYQKIGFEMVEDASSQLEEQKMYLLCYKTENIC